MNDIIKFSSATTMIFISLNLNLDNIISFIIFYILNYIIYAFSSTSIFKS